jgi:hypothetical protein
MEQFPAAIGISGIFPGAAANFREAGDAPPCVTSVASRAKCALRVSACSTKAFRRIGDSTAGFGPKTTGSGRKTPDFGRKVTHGCVTCGASMDFSQFQRFWIFPRISGSRNASDFGLKTP